MRVFILTLFISVLFVTDARAQVGRAGEQQSTGNQETQTLTPAQNAKLDEAARLVAQITKLYDEGKFDEALPLAKSVLAIAQEVYGAEHNQVATSLVNIAELYLAKKKYRDAEPLLERALKIYEKTMGADSPKLSDILERLAVVSFSRSDYGRSEKLLLRSLSLREKRLGAEHLLVGRSLAKLAEFYQTRGEYKKAEAVYQRLMPMREKLSGPMSREYGEVLERYACLMRREKRVEEAKKMEERALGIYSRDTALAMLVDNPQVLNGKAVTLPKPYYPAEAKMQRVTGTVTVWVTINENGKVVFACASGGHPLLLEPSEWAAYQATFTPTIISGRAVKVRGFITYNYKM